MSQPSKQTCELVDLRDDYKCQRCGKDLRVVGGNRHHRKLRRHCNDRERHSTANLILLCGTGTMGCHGWVHAHPAEAYEQGYLLKSWEAPQKKVMLTYTGEWVLLDYLGRRKVVVSPELLEMDDEED